MPQFFTLAEAEGLLPKVTALLQAMRDQKREYEAAEAELNAFAQRITLAGGMVVPRERIAELRTRKSSSAQALKDAFEALQESGCLLKDLDTGLVDFPTLYKDEEVYLCWKLGEAGIGFWHPIADGFRGRRGIDSEFLANHRGDSRM